MAWMLDSTVLFVKVPAMGRHNGKPEHDLFLENQIQVGFGKWLRVGNRTRPTSSRDVVSKPGAAYSLYETRDRTSARRADSKFYFSSEITTSPGRPISL